MIKTQFIEPQQTYALRQNVLRPGRPPEEAMFDDDFLQSTFHVGTFENNHLQVIATFIEQQPPEALRAYLDLPTNIPSYRLRGMATDDSARRKGFGRNTVLFAEQHLLQQGIRFLWFNARKVAYPFYTSLGYEFFGDEFEMKLIGPHKVMYKILKSDSL